jgi:branched-chain amino acid transport system ATP-binding protein
LRVEAVTSGYGNVTVLHDVTVSVADGEVLAVLGANGAGKTTLLRTIIGLLRPRSGRVYHSGRDVTAVRTELRARDGIALAPEGRGIMTTLSVEENLTLGARPALLRERRHRGGSIVADGLARAYALFPVLERRRHDSGGALSGGEQQMLCLARALMAQPDILLLDEPSLGLGPKIVTNVYEVLAVLREQGQTMVLVEESIERALSFADNACLLKNGRVFAQGSAQQVREHRGLSEAYLGSQTTGPST